MSIKIINEWRSVRGHGAAARHGASGTRLLDAFDRIRHCSPRPAPRSAGTV